MDKDKYMYHASNVKGIKELVPSVSSHGKAYVYASDNLVLALLFGAKKDDFDLLMDLSQGQVVVWECYPHAFKNIYANKSCSLYRVDAKHFKSKETNWEGEYVSEDRIPIISEEEIPNLYLELKRHMESGSLKVNYYLEDNSYREFLKEELGARMIHFKLIDYFKYEDPRGMLYFEEVLEDLES